MNLGWLQKFCACLGLIVVVALPLGCSRPKLPTLTPVRAVVTSVGPLGIGFEVQLAVENPNEVDLAARSLTAKVVLDGKIDMGTVTLPNALALPARQTTKLAIPVTMSWTDLPTVLMLATSNRPISYDVNGSVNLGGERLNVDLPFQLQGTITHEQLVQVTANSLPKLPFP